MEITERREFSLTKIYTKHSSVFKWRCFFFLMLFFMAVVLGSCSSNSITNEDVLTSKINVQLITGAGSNQITWTFSEVHRDSNYLKPDMSYVQGDSLLISGEAKTISNTGPFLQDGLPSFILQDKDGHDLQVQAAIADKLAPEAGSGTVVTFRVFFLLSNDGSRNQSIISGKDLIVTDSILTNRNISGHTSDLSSFGNIE